MALLLGLLVNMKNETFICPLSGKTLLYVMALLHKRMGAAQWIYHVLLMSWAISARSDAIAGSLADRAGPIKTLQK